MRTNRLKIGGKLFNIRFVPDSTNHDYNKGYRAGLTEALICMQKSPLFNMLEQNTDKRLLEEWENLLVDLAEMVFDEKEKEK